LGTDLALKLGLSVWMVGSAVLAVRERLFFALPFVLLFGLGYLWVALAEVRDRFHDRRSGVRAVAEPVRAEWSPVATP
jgi:hypothetical protein